MAGAQQFGTRRVSMDVESLKSLTPRELKRRAAELGASGDEIEALDDADDVKGAVIELIVASSHGKISATLVADPHRVQELLGLKLSAVKKRAAAAGVKAEDLEEADDAEDVKAAVINLILTAETSGSPMVQQKMREDLQKLKVSALKKQAVSAGIAAEALEEADDADDTKSAVIELLISQECQELQPKADPHDSLRLELARLRLKELRARAKAEGVDTEQMEDALDSDQPKKAVIELLVGIASVAESMRLQLSGLRLKELRARAKQAGHSTELLEEAADSEEPKAAVIELLLSPAPRAGKQPAPAPEPEPEPAVAAPEPVVGLARSVSTVTVGPDHPVYRALESHQLEAHFEKLLELGVKRVEDLEQITQAELQALDMKRFDLSKFTTAFLTETPHHSALSGKGMDSSGSETSGGFVFEGGKHCMLSYQWDSQSQVLSAREYLASLGIPTWMVRSYGQILCVCSLSSSRITLPGTCFFSGCRTLMAECRAISTILWPRECRRRLL